MWNRARSIKPADRRRPAGHAVAALAVGSLTLLAACGSSGSGGNTGSGGAAGARPTSAAALPVNVATGSPVVVGFLNSDTSPLGDKSYITKAARAAVAYLNNSQGGLAGHKIQLEVCADNGSTAGAATCAQQLLAKKPVVVVGGLDLGADGAVPVITKAGVPYVSSVAINPTEFVSKGAFSFYAASPGSVGAADLYIAKRLKMKKVGIITADEAAATAAANLFGKQVLAKLGVTDVKVITHSVTETDLTAAFTQATQGGAGAVMAIESPAGCAQAMQAKQATGSTAALFLFGCSDAATLRAGGAGAEGTYFGAVQSSVDASGADAATFSAAMDTYAPGVQKSLFTQAPFGVFTILSKLLASTPTLTPAAVEQVIGAARNEPGFMSPPFSCDGKQVPLLSSLCTGDASVQQVKSGKLVDVGGGFLDAFATGTGH